MRFFAVLILFCLSPLHSVSQASAHANSPEITFIPHPDQKFGLDIPGIGKPIKYYEKVKIGINGIYYAPFKSVGYKSSEPVRLVIRSKRKKDLSKLEFRIDDSPELLSFKSINDSVFDIQLPPGVKNYSLFIRYKKTLLGKLNVRVYRKSVEKIRIVKMVQGEFDTEYLEEFLNEIYKQANIEISVADVSNYSDTIFDNGGLLKNPSALNDRYTAQMRQFRDRYFDLHPKHPKDCYYLFIVPGFVDPELDGYMVRDHAFGFIKQQLEPDMFHSIARELGHGIGILEHFWLATDLPKGGTLNLMDQNGGSELMKFQWDKLKNPSRSYNFFDGDEDVRTKNGQVAYYFWEEDKEGFIHFASGSPLTSIQRPFKKNYLSFHLNLNDELFEVIFQWSGIRICLWHMIIIGLTFLIWLFIRIIHIVKRKRAEIKPKFLKRKFRAWTINVSMLSIGILAYITVGFFLKKHEIISGFIPAFTGLSMEQVKNRILNNPSLSYHKVQTPRTEVLLKRDGKWYVKKRDKVLYFDVYMDARDQFSKCIFRRDSDRLVIKTRSYNEKASSHYMVFRFINEDDELEKEMVYNHVGVDITKKLTITDAAKRILLLVNGYRPTTEGHNYEDNYADIIKNGFEFPNSLNMIYTTDHYKYWERWDKINKRFIDKLNPAETYYADGHFSVSTSNHRNLYNFTKLATIYPKRCRNLRKHKCYHTNVISTGIVGKKKKETYSMLSQDPNRKGFRERLNNGKIAAKNLLMMFNEIPNRSNNDTIYIVAHSMGYAYALGMIEELRGKIKFGGFYIIAPENAGMGRLRQEEWSEVWQYGSRLNKKSKDAPCIQDGIAPQVCARGLNERYRVYFPYNMHKKLGFFNSHFIGNYTWIFNIPEGQRGYIRQR
jgi:hypothetical protein